MTIINVAAKILEIQGSMTTMKLQKLAYYSQAHSLATTGLSLFPEDFEAWRNGPVSLELFNRHRGRFMIHHKELLFTRYENGIILNQEQVDIINAVCNKLGKLTGNELSERTHQEAPWIQARIGIPEHMGSEEIISKQSMRDYYMKHPIV
ncbi:type II toxin-antitoxin system antitoxin SocA domain-containing protein [Gardnerella sp. Marseille-Q2328]|uniref:Panacea domain-containing protein n=1 Tax=Gardnerella sp. Marseille-Q2328 TaxID=2759694 RepID=UPI0020255179|nr:type II toxin-antitoxin system antitoxin SocA domain-containing protein [Gardnerella sp. Marseille-Q2328]